MPSEQRLKGINAVIRRVVGEQITHVSNFPSSTFITVTKVKVSANLEWADIGVSVYPDAQADAVLKFLNRFRVEFQSAIGDTLRARRTPKIRFSIDTSIAEAEKLFANGL